MNKLSFKYLLAITLLNLLSKTWRIKLSGEYQYQNKGIIVFWHGLMLPVWKYFGKYNPFAVVSLSKDGEILSQLLTKWGFSLIRGSSSRKGSEVLDEIVNKSSDKLILITPDGPQGPIYKMKAGAVVAASRAGVPLYLANVTIKKYWEFDRSWDKFKLPKPFSSIVINISDPIYIEKTDNKELISSKISELEINLLYLNT